MAVLSSKDFYNPQYNTASTMLDSRFGVLGVKNFTFSLLNLLLLSVAKQLSFCFI